MLLTLDGSGVLNRFRRVRSKDVSPGPTIGRPTLFRCCYLPEHYDKWESLNIEIADGPKTSATGFEYTLGNITTTRPTLSR